MKNKSFTLIELLLIIAIISLLVLAFSTVVPKARERARIAKILHFSSSLHRSLGAYTFGEWRFEENINDTSGNNNHGKWNGGDDDPPPEKFVDSAPGMDRKALFFDGSSYIELPSSNFLIRDKNSWTVAVWFKASSIPSSEVYGRIIVLGRKNTGPGTALSLSVGKDDKALFRYYDNNQNYKYFHAGAISTNKWYFFAVTYNGKKFVSYLNGNPESKEDSFLGTGSYQGMIGAWGHSGTNPNFNGIIDEVRIYEKPLSASKIQRIYAEKLDIFQNFDNL